MDISNIDSECKKNIQNYSLDTLKEKHELTSWYHLINKQSFSYVDENGETKTIVCGKDVQFLTVNRLDILLPVPKTNHGNITVNQCIVSEDKQVVLLFLTDRTYYGDDEFQTGYMAVCKKVPDCS